MKIRVVLLIAAVVLLSSLASCKTTQTNTAAIEATTSAAEGMTPEQEYYLGRAVAANILSSYRIYDGNPALTDYLNNIRAAITANSPRPDVYNGYHVAILDSNEVNAFATPGGHIFVTRGLISAAKSEDALAGVIAHEVAHIQLQHGLKAIKTSRITQAIMITSMAVVEGVTERDLTEATNLFNNTIGQIVNTLVNKGYSKSQEYDADSAALRLMTSAGYNPRGLIDVLEELKAVQKNVTGGFNKTHPTPADRIKKANKLIKNYSVTDSSSYRQERFNSVAR